jgi:hypothetical protein
MTRIWHDRQHEIIAAIDFLSTRSGLPWAPDDVDAAGCSSSVNIGVASGPPGLASNQQWPHPVAASQFDHLREGQRCNSFGISVVRPG